MPLTAYLAGARIIHVTSFLDDRTAGALARPAARGQAGRPGNLISFDPGHVWSFQPHARGRGDHRAERLPPAEQPRVRRGGSALTRGIRRRGGGTGARPLDNAAA